MLKEFEDKTIISVSGYGGTGSSAVLDWLKECEDVDVFDECEFQICYFPDALHDLDYKLNEACCRFYDSDVAIRRFLDVCEKLDRWYDSVYHGQFIKMAEEYISYLTPVTWDGYWAFDRLHTPKEHIAEIDRKNQRIEKNNKLIHQLNRLLRKLNMKQLPYQELLPYYNRRTMYQCIKPDGFIVKTQNFIEKLLEIATKRDTKFLAINQLLPPQFPYNYYKYFKNNVQSIVVTRDPRDMYYRIHNISKWPVIPCNNVNEFIGWYKDNMADKANVNDGSILYVKFEDMIYEYERTTEKIKLFLGLEDTHTGHSYFNPNMSVVNTQIFKRSNQNKDDIKKIEDELPQYLYDYENHKQVECIVRDTF